MDLSGCHFTYAGIFSREHGLIFVNCDTSRYIAINGETKTASMYSNSEKRSFYISDENKPISFEAEIMTENGDIIDSRTARNIERWLFNRSGYAKLYVDPADECDDYSYGVDNGVMKQSYFNCRFVNPQKLEGNGGLVGFAFAIECDSHMLWQDTVIKTFHPNLGTEAASETLEIFVDSDMNDYIYPKVSVTMGDSGGDIAIYNMTDNPNRATGFVSLSGNISFSAKGGVNHISGGNYIKFSEKNFVRLLPGVNAITIMGNIKDISFEWENRRYL